MNENAKNYTEENYNGHAIMPDLLDGYTVDYEGDEVWFKTKDEAKAFIDKEFGKKDNKANIIDGDLSGVKKNDNLTPTNALKIEKMNEAQLDNEIAKTQREIDRLDSVMKKNTKESEFTKQFPLGVGGSGWSADRKKQFVKNIESETKQAKNYTDAIKESF